MSTNPNDIIRAGNTTANVAIANNSGKIVERALPNTSVVAGEYNSFQPTSNGESQVLSLTVDSTGRLLQVINTAMKITGRDFEETGNTSASYKVFISSASPNTSGSNGDIWYKVEP